VVKVVDWLWPSSAAAAEPIPAMTPAAARQAAPMGARARMTDRRTSGGSPFLDLALCQALLETGTRSIARTTSPVQRTKSQSLVKA
jgi:hypothetical protein